VVVFGIKQSKSGLDEGAGRSLYAFLQAGSFLDWSFVFCVPALFVFLYAVVTAKWLFISTSASKCLE